MQYKVNATENYNPFGSYQVKLQHIQKNDLEIQFDALSSGERVLMALVASVYKSAGDKHFPDILLLDEVDASLHPSMMKNMIEVIDEFFVRNGVKVILVTHSPTTIAIAPDDSLYIMNRSGNNRIEKKSREEALSILTQGYATIEEGLKLFDEVARTKVTIITEGNNITILNHVLKLNNIDNVEVLAGVEGITGKNQLKTLFDFLSRIPHKNRTLFVWDCDVNPGVNETNNTVPFVLPRNPSNGLVTKGIENMFAEGLFDEFITTVNPSKGEEIRKFDESRKRDFEQFVLSKNDSTDFDNFRTFVKEVRRLL